MADFTALKATIQQYIKQNGNEEITGAILQDVLLSMVNTMGDGAINTLTQDLSDEITARGGADSILQGNIDSLGLSLTALATFVSSGYIFRGIANQSTVPSTLNGKVFYLTSTSGQYSHMGNITVQAGISALLYDGEAWSAVLLIAMDNAPTEDSGNMVKSGGVHSAIASEAARALTAETNSVEFNSTTKYLIFKNSAGTVLYQMDASVFVIDGMVQNVEIKDVTISGQTVTCLVISFNTDAGKQDINIPLTQIFNPANYYDKTAIDALLLPVTTRLNAGYLYMGLATVAGTPDTSKGKVFYLTATAGTYTNYGNTVVADGLTILSYDGTSWTGTLLKGLDSTPTQNSTNLITSGGVQNELALGAVYDVSAKNPTAGPNNDGKWESLSALLSDANLNTLIPTAYRKGGMSIKFVSSSDNKYVQFRLMSDTFNTIPTNWQGVDNAPTAGSDNLVKSGGVYESLRPIESRFKLTDYPYEIQANNKSIYADGSIGSDVGYKLNKLLPVKAGTVFHIKSMVGTGGLAWCLYSTNEYNQNNVISKATGSGSYSDYEYTAPEDAYLGTCFAVGDSWPFELKILTPIVTILQNDKTLKYDERELLTIKEDNELGDEWNKVASSDSVAIVKGLLSSDIKVLSLDKTTNKNHYIRQRDGVGIIANGIGQTFCVVPVIADDVILFTSNADGSQVVLSYSETATFETTEIIIEVNSSYDKKEYFARIKKSGYAIISGLANSLYAVRITGYKIPEINVDNYPNKFADITHVASSKSLGFVMDILGLGGYRIPILDKSAHNNYYISYDGSIAHENGLTYCVFPISAGETIIANSNPSGTLAVIAYSDVVNPVSASPVIVSDNVREERQWRATFTKDGYAVISGYNTTLSAFVFSNKNVMEKSISGTERDLTEYLQEHSFNVKRGYKHISVQQCFYKNINNYEGNTILMSLHDGNNSQVDIVLEHNIPSNVLLPQKENTSREQNIKLVDFPMSVKQDRIVIKNGNTEISSILLDGTFNQPFIRRVPAMTIQYLPAQGVDLSTMTDLKLYITKDANNIADTLIIKKGSTVIYSYQFDSSRDIALVYRDIRDGLAELENYEFKVLFADIDGATVSDIVCTKDSGLPFVTEYSSNCTTSGTMRYDNYAVFIEVLDNDPFELEAVVRDNLTTNNLTKIFYEGQYLGQFNGDFTTVSYGSAETRYFQVSYDPTYNLFNTKRPIIRGLTGHEFSTQPIPDSYSDMEEDPYGTGRGTAIGAVNYMVHTMKKRGWSNVSTDEITQYMMDKNYPLPHKCFFIEMDDLGDREKVNKIFSDEEPYLRQMEILKMAGVKMCYALMLDDDYELFQKIENGTATEEEKNTLTTMMPDSYIYRLRAMMRNYGWSVSIHTFVGPVAQVTASRYDDVVLSIRNSIKWMERMLGATPRSYVTDGTGNSSPYFRRVMQMYGIQRVYQDYDSNYSQGRMQTHVVRGTFYSKTTFSDFDWQKQ